MKNENQLVVMANEIVATYRKKLERSENFASLRQQYLEDMQKELRILKNTFYEMYPQQDMEDIQQLFNKLNP